VSLQEKDSIPQDGIGQDAYAPNIYQDCGVPNVVYVRQQIPLANDFQAVTSQPEQGALYLSRQCLSIPIRY
jgi:hypothetical protein